MNIDPIVQVITRRRKEAGMTRANIADIAGMSLKTYQRIERGESDMKLTQFRAILRALKITDLDVFLDSHGVENIHSADVAAASRLLGKEAQFLLTKLIFLIAKEK